MTDSSSASLTRQPSQPIPIQTPAPTPPLPPSPQQQQRQPELLRPQSLPAHSLRRGVESVSLKPSNPSPSHQNSSPRKSTPSIPQHHNDKSRLPSSPLKSSSSLSPPSSAGASKVKPKSKWKSKQESATGVGVGVGVGDEEDFEELTDEDLIALDIDFDDGRGRIIQFRQQRLCQSIPRNDMVKFQQDSLVKSALSQGVDLRTYSGEISHSLGLAEESCIQDYLTSHPSLVSLHSQLSTCDGILQSMESMLSHFQSDLGSISSEIQHLQEKSQQMQIRLTNRKEAESSLFSFINHIYIPESLAHQLIEGDITEQYILCLHSLHQRLLYLIHHTPNKPHSLQPSINDVAPSLLRLKLKSIQRIRLFLLERFHSFQKPKTNIQIKQKLLLKYRYLYEFLLFHTDLHNQYHHILAPYMNSSVPPIPPLDLDVAAEIRTAYIATMSAIYASKFKRYLNSLTALANINPISKDDLLGSSEYTGNTNPISNLNNNNNKPIYNPNASVSSLISSSLSLSSLFAVKRSPVEINRAFILNNKDSVLNDTNDLIIPHIATQLGTKYHYERIYKSSLSLLMDTATSEYDFIVDFFGERLPRPSDMAGVYEEEYNEEKRLEAIIPSHNPPPSRSNSSNSAIGVEPSPRMLDEEKGRENLSTSSRDKLLFNSVFSPVVQLYLSNLEMYLNNCYDLLSILILIRILCQSNLLMQHRRVHALDSLFDRMNMMLWPRFKYLFDQHVRSVMGISFIELKGNKTTNTPSTAPLTSTNSPYHRPLYVTIRYANLCASVHRLNKDYNDDILLVNLKRLRVEVEKLISRTGARINMPKMQIVFFINQYTCICRILNNAGVNETEDAKAWRALAASQIQLFVEEELSEKFSSLITFVKQIEQSLAAEERQQQQQQQQQQAYSTSSSSPTCSSNSSPVPTPVSVTLPLPPPTSEIVDMAALESLVKHFAKYWREGIDAMNNSVKQHFGSGSSATANTPTPTSRDADNEAGSTAVLMDETGGIEILKQILVQLVLYSRRFEDIIKMFARNRPNIVKDVVHPTTILNEIKKYAK